MSTMDNTPTAIMVEGHEATEVGTDDLGLCFQCSPTLLVADSAMQIVGEANPLRITEVGIANLLGAALVTKCKAIMVTRSRETFVGGQESRHVPNLKFNEQLDFAKREAAIAATHIETAVMYLNKARERLG